MRSPKTLLLIATLPLLSAAPSTSTGERPTALVIEQGSVARRQMVALGRDLLVAGQAESDVVAINGNARIRGRVVGDVIVLGGDALLGSAAEVGGDVFVLGGQMRAAEGARIDGRSVSYPTVSAVWLTLLEGPSLGLPATAPVVLGAKLALLAAWLIVTLLLLAANGREILVASEQVRSEPARDFFTGLAAVLALLLTALFFSAFAAAIVGIPLLVLVLVLALILKLWGMVAVFHAVGDWLSSKLLRKRLLPLSHAVLGSLVLGTIKLVPWVGTWVWTVASLIAVGGTLATKFGRREPWFEYGADLTSTA